MCTSGGAYLREACLQASIPLLLHLCLARLCHPVRFSCSVSCRLHSACTSFQSDGQMDTCMMHIRPAHGVSDRLCLMAMNSHRTQESDGGLTDKRLTGLSEASAACEMMCCMRIQRLALPWPPQGMRRANLQIIREDLHHSRSNAHSGLQGGQCCTAWQCWDSQNSSGSPLQIKPAMIQAACCEASSCCLVSLQLSLALCPS